MAVSSPTIQIEPSWKACIGDEFTKPYMQSLRHYLQQQKKAGKTIYPRGKEIFKAFDLTPVDQVKVVLLGQDPYHGPNQAHGLCFSVPKGVRPPPSLVNIYKELTSDLGVEPANHGCLEYWAKQGVLLLNSVLTVEQGQAASHQGQGWEQFTDSIIQRLNENKQPLVFVLWGAYAQKKGQCIDVNKHLVIRSVHPSPLSAHRGFFGSRPFSQINAFLEKTGQKAIDWRLPESI